MRRCWLGFVLIAIIAVPALGFSQWLRVLPREREVVRADDKVARPEVNHALIKNLSKVTFGPGAQELNT